MALLALPCGRQQQQPVNLRHSPWARTQRIFSDSDNVVVVVVRHYDHHHHTSKKTKHVHNDRDDNDEKFNIKENQQ